MEEVMVADTTHIRVDKELWELVKERADMAGITGAAMVRNLLDPVSVGVLLAKQIRVLEAFCAEHESELVDYFEEDWEGKYNALKQFMGETLSEIEDVEDADELEDDEEDGE